MEPIRLVVLPVRDRSRSPPPPPPPPPVKFEAQRIKRCKALTCVVDLRRCPLRCFFRKGHEIPPICLCEAAYRREIAGVGYEVYYMAAARRRAQ